MIGQHEQKNAVIGIDALFDEGPADRFDDGLRVNEIPAKIDKKNDKIPDYLTVFYENPGACNLSTWQTESHASGTSPSLMLPPNNEGHLVDFYGEERERNESNEKINHEFMKVIGDLPLLSILAPIGAGGVFGVIHYIFVRRRRSYIQTIEESLESEVDSK